MFASSLGELRYVVYAYDKVKLFSIPVNEHILVFSADSAANVEDLAKKVLYYITLVESGPLSLSSLQYYKY